MLDMAQVAVGRGQVVGRRAAGTAERDQLLDRGDGPAQAQIRTAAAPDQLLGLGEELDLADAAAADLDVVAADRDLALAAISLHLPLHVMDVGQRGEIEMLAPDE